MFALIYLRIDEDALVTEIWIAPTKEELIERFIREQLDNIHNGDDVDELVEQLRDDDNVEVSEDRMFVIREVTP